MKRLTFAAITLALLAPAAAAAQQERSYDYFAPQREMIQRGVQAILQCNGLFTGDRSLEQVFEQELAYLRDPVGTAEGGDYVVDWERKAVAIGEPGTTPTMRAAFREGIGCVILSPEQTFDDIDDLPILTTTRTGLDPAGAAWPDGDLVMSRPLPRGVDPVALEAASDWTFDRESPEQVTLSLIVLHDGEIIHERYARGIDMFTKTRTWSTAKSIASTLIGMLVDEGKLALDEPLPFDWLPENAGSAENDPRREITLRHVLNMSSGLYPVDSWGMEYATGSGFSYWAGESSVHGARNRSLMQEPGTFWDYENYDTLLGVYAMKQAIGDPQAYLEFPRERLLDRIGMRNTLLSTDRFGDFIMSSQIYTTARDLARFGLLYAQNGMWKDERLISEEWIDFVRTPAPATSETGNFYGGQFWLVPDDRTDVPKDAYSTAGNRGQFVVIVPSHDVVIVRRGLDYGRQGFDRWDMTREVLKAFEPVATNP
ncbi:MAG: serine hydrolase [Gemmatimonadales bacterium]|nr:serine hydrolase [Gemmatimonadales bacterium]MYG49486.1 serine hydrolase [Gemmatimonadales bacterium]MYK00726.1 serine hydrolase [Candidatus Palauibacter ramosifaciens]